MNKKNVLIPFLIAILAAVIYYLVLSLAQNKINSTQTMKTVVVAANDVPEGRVLTKTHLKTAEIPAAFVQKDAYEGTDLSQVENLVTKIFIARGNQIVKPALQSLSAEAGISLKVRPNYRAFILSVDNGVSNLIKPGDKVDVLLTFDALLKSGSKEKMTATILQDIEVLGVGSNLGQGMDAATRAGSQEQAANAAAFSDSSALSLALSPVEAQYLALAREEGEVTLIVRSTGDGNMHPIEISSFSKLFS
ncbi:MAG: Flp pilus assembly protein CpaB [Elusimicrobiota bacterium]|jgi:pilus assembly protein CpaB|nr:Flp pilus assembly protein CpaB [Elusimicrobiota bacterium]